MSKRLQVLLEDKELLDIQRVAKQQQMTVAEWVRQALRSARRQIPTYDQRKKLEVLRAASRQNFPIKDIEQVLQEIEAGYPTNLPS
ncbi:MAG: antitoxin [Nitrospirales bacterium]|nr:MAG: antitoxin [Nitrospirales bacterium]